MARGSNNQASGMSLMFGPRQAAVLNKRQQREIAKQDRAIAKTVLVKQNAKDKALYVRTIREQGTLHLEELSQLVLGKDHYVGVVSHDFKLNLERDLQRVRQGESFIDKHEDGFSLLIDVGSWNDYDPETRTHTGQYYHFNKQGQLHKIGSASASSNTGTFWHRNGKLHRETGAAVSRSTRSSIQSRKEYYLSGKRFASYTDYQVKVKQLRAKAKAKATEKAKSRSKTS